MFRLVVVVIWCWLAKGAAAAANSSDTVSATVVGSATATSLPLLLRKPPRQRHGRRRRTRRITFTSTNWLKQLLFPPSYAICQDDDDDDDDDVTTTTEDDEPPNMFVTTHWVHFWAQWIHVHWLGDAVAGECAKVCATACQTLQSTSSDASTSSSSSTDWCPHVVEETRCACRSCNVQGIIAAPTPPTAPPSSFITNTTTSCFQSDQNETAACTDDDDPCRGACNSSALQVCVASNTATANATDESTGYECACIPGAVPSSATASSDAKVCVITCQTPAGNNPCGPGTACTNDANVGHVCTPLYDVTTTICPVGCPPTEECANGTCVCRAGFVREIPYLPCVAV
jgi:hypothetical protein